MRNLNFQFIRGLGTFKIARAPVVFRLQNPFQVSQGFILAQQPLPICTYVKIRQSVNIYELLLTYCHITKNLRSFAFVCLLNGIFFVKYKDLISGYPARYPALSDIRLNHNYKVITLLKLLYLKLQSIDRTISLTPPCFERSDR